MFDIPLFCEYIAYSSICGSSLYAGHERGVDVHRMYNARRILPSEPERIISSATSRIKDMHPGRRIPPHRTLKRATPNGLANMETSPERKETKSEYGQHR